MILLLFCCYVSLFAAILTFRYDFVWLGDHLIISSSRWRQSTMWLCPLIGGHSVSGKLKLHPKDFGSIIFWCFVGAHLRYSCDILVWFCCNSAEVGESPVYCHWFAAILSSFAAVCCYSHLLLFFLWFADNIIISSSRWWQSTMWLCSLIGGHSVSGKLKLHPTYFESAILWCDIAIFLRYCCCKWYMFGLLWLYFFNMF